MRCGRGSLNLIFVILSQSTVHCFLLALHTNLAADEAKLGVWCCARTGGDTDAGTSCTPGPPATPKFLYKASKSYRRVFGVTHMPFPMRVKFK